MKPCTTMLQIFLWGHFATTEDRQEAYNKAMEEGIMAAWETVGKDGKVYHFSGKKRSEK